MSAMTARRIHSVILACIILLSAYGCANIVPPTGGKKDETPPVLLSVTPADSLRNTRVSKIELRFDEFVTVSDAASEVQISPLLSVPLNVVAINRKVTVKIPDTLLRDNTTYRITFGNSIKDLHEGNPFSKYSYIFSTGSYFDSLEIKGRAYNAATGLPDSGVVILLYDAAKSDSVVVREKPVYVGRSDAQGVFSIQGLPERSFRVYALKDANNNLIFDGGREGIAFLDSVIIPGRGAPPLDMQVFVEAADTSGIATDTGGRRPIGKPTMSPDPKAGFTYNVAVDTGDVRKRTVEVIEPIEISFNKILTEVSDERINLTYDDNGTPTEQAATISIDSTRSNVALIQTQWLDNRVYTLRLLKGFAKDSAGTEALPSKYTFRTKQAEDYATLQIHVGGMYYGDGYVLMVTNEKDTIYQKPITDTMVKLERLAPATYRLRIIVDKNKNGKWDTGDLLGRRQPEMVIPYNTPINLKAGWENMVDFLPSAKPEMREGTSTGKRDK